MTEEHPVYATAKTGLSAANDQPRKIGVRVARSLSDMMQIVAIRASVFMGGIRTSWRKSCGVD